jgi:hypothetical protein
VTNTLAYCNPKLIATIKKSYSTVPWTCVIKHYRLVMARFCSKLGRLSKPVKVTDNSG